MFCELENDECKPFRGLQSKASMHKLKVACQNPELLFSVWLWIRGEADVPGSLRWCCYC